MGAGRAGPAANGGQTPEAPPWVRAQRPGVGAGGEASGAAPGRRTRLRFFRLLRGSGPRGPLPAAGRPGAVPGAGPRSPPPASITGRSHGNGAGAAQATEASASPARASPLRGHVASGLAPPPPRGPPGGWRGAGPNPAAAAAPAPAPLSPSGAAPGPRRGAAAPAPAAVPGGWRAGPPPR